MKSKLITILLLYLFPLLTFAQNYEQQGDELFAQAQYEKAEKKYKAAIEMSGTSTSLQSKKEKCAKCASLLVRAKSAEENASDISEYIDASKLYSDLFAVHALPIYRNKANALQRKADTIREQQRTAEQAERERQAKLEAERKARLEAERQSQIEKDRKYREEKARLEAARKAEQERAQKKRAESTKDYNDNIYDFQEHIVKKNEGLYRIGVYYGVSQKEIIDWNPELTSKGLYEGQVLYIPLRSTNQREEDNSATNSIQQEEREHAKIYVNGHRAVDMGLSVRWADCNIGANHSYDTGDYYAWGETSPKVSFPWNTYKHISNGKLIKYCSNSSSGRVDNKRILETQDDAAYVNWGNAWRIPTKEQWEELADNNKCKWEWTTDSGVYGYKVTSKITGNSIFLPVTGYKPGGTRIEHPELGLYWTSTLFTGQYDNGYLAAYRFDLGQTHYNCRGTHRCNGRAIRAVCR